MATRKTAAKKTSKAKAWETETIAEFKESKAIVWRAQKSTSPQGQEFVGIRKFRIDAEGEAMPDGRCGFQVKIEDAPKAMPAVLKLLGKLIKTLDDAPEENEEDEGEDTSLEDDDEDAKPAKKTAGKKAASAKKEILYVIQTKSGKFFQVEDDDVKVVIKLKDATCLTKAKAEEILEDYDASAGLKIVKVRA